jgi:hypothetical protein
MIASVRNPLSPPSTRTVNGWVDRSPVEGEGCGDDVGSTLDELVAVAVGEALAGFVEVVALGVGEGPHAAMVRATISSRALTGVRTRAHIGRAYHGVTQGRQAGR